MRTPFSSWGMHSRLSSRQALSIPAVSSRGLTKSFARGLARAASRVTALEAVDLDVDRGEIVGLVGSAGAGKTTLLQCLSGLLRTDAGTVRCPPKTAYVAAVPVYYPFLTPRDVLAVSIARRGLSGMWPVVVERTLSVLELDCVARLRIAALPRDALKRLAVAEALVLQPEAILVDSNPADRVPFDAVTLRALAAYAATGTAIVIAARDATAVAPVAPRQVQLEGGRNTSKPGRIVAERVH